MLQRREELGVHPLFVVRGKSAGLACASTSGETEVLLLMKN